MPLYWLEDVVEEDPSDVVDFSVESVVESPAESSESVPPPTTTDSLAALPVAPVPACTWSVEILRYEGLDGTRTFM